jgi:hypothetical protein
MLLEVRKSFGKFHVIILFLVWFGVPGYLTPFGLTTNISTFLGSIVILDDKNISAELPLPNKIGFTDKIYGYFITEVVSSIGVARK